MHALIVYPFLALTLSIGLAGVWVTKVFGFDHPLLSIVIAGVLALAVQHRKWSIPIAYSIIFAMTQTAYTLGVTQQIGFAPVAPIVTFEAYEPDQQTR